MNVGKLFQAKKDFLLLYPSKEVVSEAAYDSVLGGARADMCSTAADATSDASWWSSYYKCNVSYLEPKSVFCLIEQDGELYKILTDDGILGWIYIPQKRLMFVIEEVNQ